MTLPVLAAHYQKIADVSPIPIIIYNFPPGTGIDLAAELLIELSHHPNIIGVKDTGGIMPKMGETIRLAAPGFQVLGGFGQFPSTGADDWRHRWYFGTGKYCTR